jgi:hypothetical protein
MRGLRIAMRDESRLDTRRHTLLHTSINRTDVDRLFGAVCGAVTKIG